MYFTYSTISSVSIALAMGVLALVSAFGAENDVPDFRSIDVDPALREKARKLGIMVGRMTRPRDRSELLSGDSVMGVISYIKEGEESQWMVRLVSQSLTKGEENMDPIPVRMQHTSTGREVSFEGSRGSMSISILGPAVRPIASKRADIEDVEYEWISALVNEQFLKLGFDNAGRAIVRLNSLEYAPNEGPQRFTFASSVDPFPADQVLKNKILADRFGLTFEEERALVGTAPALMEFITIASELPGFREVVFDILDVSLTKFLIKGAKIPHISFKFLPGVEDLHSSDWGQPDSVPVYGLPLLLSLDGEERLAIKLAIIKPMPPYLVSAGILGLAAKRPNEENGPYLMLRVIGSRAR